MMRQWPSMKSEPSSMIWRYYPREDIDDQRESRFLGRIDHQLYMAKIGEGAYILYIMPDRKLIRLCKVQSSAIYSAFLTITIEVYLGKPSC